MSSWEIAKHSTNKCHGAFSPPPLNLNIALFDVSLPWVWRSPRYLPLRCACRTREGLDCTPDITSPHVLARFGWSGSTRFPIRVTVRYSVCSHLFHLSLQPFPICPRLRSPSPRACVFIFNRLGINLPAFTTNNLPAQDR